VATFIKFIVSTNEFNPVPIINLSLFLFVEIEFNKLIFSLTGINWACPVLPKKATPWHPWFIIFSAWRMVFWIFSDKSSFKIDYVAA